MSSGANSGTRERSSGCGRVARFVTPDVRSRACRGALPTGPGDAGNRPARLHCRPVRDHELGEQSARRRLLQQRQRRALQGRGILRARRLSLVASRPVTHPSHRPRVPLFRPQTCGQSHRTASCPDPRLSRNSPLGQNRNDREIASSSPPL